MKNSLFLSFCLLAVTLAAQITPGGGIQPIMKGGTGATTAASARTNLGLANVENTALSTWAGTTNVTTLGTIATGTWNATALGAAKGGTGLTTYTTGDILYASASTTLSALASSTAGKVLVAGGASTAPAWSSYILSGTSGQTYTFPTTSSTLARTDAEQTFTGTQTFGAISATTFALSSSTGQIATINSTNVNGPYLTFSASSSATGDIGSATNVFGAGATTDFGVNSRGTTLYLGQGNSVRATLTSTTFTTNAISATTIVATANDFQITAAKSGNEPWYFRNHGSGSAALHLNGVGDIVVLTAAGISVSGEVSATTRFKSVSSVSSTGWGATGGELLANSTYGACISGYGTTADVTLLSRAGTPALEVVPNTANIIVRGTLSASGNIIVTNGVVTSPVGTALQLRAASNTSVTIGVDGGSQLTVAGYAPVGISTGLSVTGPTSTSTEFYATGSNTRVFYANGAGTGYQFGQIVNTGGGLLWGVEDSGGGDLIAGSTAYDSVIRGASGGIAFSTNSGSAMQMRLSNAGLAVAGTYTSGAPSGGTAAAWKLGSVASVSPTSPNRTVELDVNGTIYYLAAKTTNN